MSKRKNCSLGKHQETELEESNADYEDDRCQLKELGCDPLGMMRASQRGGGWDSEESLSWNVDKEPKLKSESPVRNQLQGVRRTPNFKRHLSGQTSKTYD